MNFPYYDPSFRHLEHTTWYYCTTATLHSLSPRSPDWDVEGFKLPQD